MSPGRRVVLVVAAILVAAELASALPAGRSARLRQLRIGSAPRHRRRVDRGVPLRRRASAPCSPGSAACGDGVWRMGERRATGTCWQRPSACRSPSFWPSPPSPPFARMGGIPTTESHSIMTVSSSQELLDLLSVPPRFPAATFLVTDADRFRGEVIDRLVREAVFNPDAGLRDAARWIIWEASQALGCPSASIHELYMARGRGEFSATDFTVPAINVRAATYLTRAAGLRRRHGARRGHRDLRDRQERDGLHRPAPRGVHRGDPRRRDPHRLAGSGLPPGRPLPVQRRRSGRRTRRRRWPACAS